MNIRKIITISLVISLILIVIFAAGCTSPEQQNVPTSPVSTPVAATSNQFDGYTVTDTINTNVPLDTRLVTETAVADALNKIEAEIAAKLGGLDTSTLQFDASDYGKYLKVGKDGKITLGNVSSGGSSKTYITNAVWGEIGGDINFQKDLMEALNAKQNKLTAGSNITITEDGVISATTGGGGGGGSSYTLPVASTTRLGGVKIGTGINITSDGQISVEASAPRWDQVSGKPFDSLGEGLTTDSTSNDLKLKLNLSDNSGLKVTEDGKLVVDTEEDSDLKTKLDEKQNTITDSAKLSADLVDDSSSINKFVTAAEKTAWTGKQDALLSGTNIKTINNESLLGSGDIEITGEANVLESVKDSSGNELTITDKAVQLSKGAVGLGYVDNTSDADKPISTATQTALDAKQNAITDSAKLSADLVENGTTNKFNVKADWNAESGSDAEILNKPTIPEHLYLHNIFCSLYRSDLSNTTIYVSLQIIDTNKDKYNNDTLKNGLKGYKYAASCLINKYRTKDPVIGILYKNGDGENGFRAYITPSDYGDTTTKTTFNNLSASSKSFDDNVVTLF